MRFNNVQIMRALAANMVVASHLLSIETKYGHGLSFLPDSCRFLASGVDLFFVISGFIMAVTAGERSPGAFLKARVCRIYPLYWFYSLAVLCVFLVAPQIVNASASSSPSILKSFLLIPDSTLYLLAVGWTLTHEMYFYLVFAGVLLLAPQKRWMGFCLWATCVLGANALFDGGPLFSVVSSPLTFEFIAGVYIGYRVLDKRPISPLPALVFGGAVFVLGVMLSDAGTFNATDNWIRIWVFGLPFAAIVCAAVFSSDVSEDNPLVILGDASYSLYLLHVPMLSLVGRIFALQPIHTPLIHGLFLVVSIVAVNVAALVSYQYIEKPLTKAAHQLIFRRVAV